MSYRCRIDTSALGRRDRCLRGLPFATAGGLWTVHNLPGRVLKCLRSRVNECKVLGTVISPTISITDMPLTLTWDGAGVQCGPVFSDGYAD